MQTCWGDRQQIKFRGDRLKSRELHHLSFRCFGWLKGSMMEHGCWTNSETIPHNSPSSSCFIRFFSCFMSVSWVFHPTSATAASRLCTCQSTRGKAKKRRSWGKSKSRVPSCNKRPSTMREGSQKNSFQSCHRRMTQMTRQGKKILQQNRCDINQIKLT